MTAWTRTLPGVIHQVHSLACVMSHSGPLTGSMSVSSSRPRGWLHERLERIEADIQWLSWAALGYGPPRIRSFEGSMQWKRQMMSRLDHMTQRRRRCSVISIIEASTNLIMDVAVRSDSLCDRSWEATPLYVDSALTFCLNGNVDTFPILFRDRSLQRGACEKWAVHLEVVHCCDSCCKGGSSLGDFVCLSRAWGICDMLLLIWWVLLCVLAFPHVIS